MVAQDALHLVRPYLAALEHALTELLGATERVSAAVLQAQPGQVEQAARSESECVVRLRKLLGDRAAILARLPANGKRPGSLTEFIGRCGAEGDRRRLAQVRQLTQRLQHDALVQWIVLQRCQQHVAEFLDFVGNCGETSPTYQVSPGRGGTGSGGAMLDAAV